MTLRKIVTMTTVATLATLLISTNAFSTPLAIAFDDFGPGSTLQTFSSSGLFAGTLPDAYTLGGITYSYSLGNRYLRGVYSGPVTSYVFAPFIQGTRADGILTMQLSFAVNRFGFGFDLTSFAGVIPNAATVSIFKGTAPLGSLSFKGMPEITGYSAGFAGIESTDAFDRVEVTFADSTGDRQFRIDNIRTEVVNVPESTPFVFLSAGLAALSMTLPRCWPR